jgi:hypothetical protein
VYYPGVLQIDQAQRLVLRPGDETEADFSMHRVKTVSVSGRVVVPAGVGSSVSVGLYPADSDAYIAEQGALADEKGNFQIARVPAGSYLLTATAPADGERVYTARQRIEIGTEDVDSITLVLGRGVSIRGLVRAENRSSLPGSQVFVEVLQLDSEGGASIGRVHQDGTFELFSLHEGSYEVRVFGVKPDWYVKSAKAGTEDLLEKGLQVEKDAPGVMEIVLSSASAELEGTVTDNDQPLPGAHVLLIPDPESRFNRYRFESAITDQNGHFQIKGIVPGNYRVLAKQTASSGKTPATSEPQMISFTERDRKTLAVSMAKPSD